MIISSLAIRKTNKKKIFKALVITLIILVLGILWQYIMSLYEVKEYAPPGQLIEVNNHKMHIYVKGEGSPTVIFTVGSGTPCAFTDYYFIQKEISKATRTISYDRPGYGWSGPITKPNNISEQVNELHELLSKAGEKPPYILVGHSLSSLEVIHFAQLFPKEVSGIILIDGGNPTFYAENIEFSALAINHLFEGVRVTGLARALGSVGVFPPFLGEDLRHKMLPQELQQMDKVMFYNKLGLGISRSSLRNINENAKKVVERGKLGNIPLVILTAGNSMKEWKESQIQLKDWSNNSKHEEIIGASHYIHWSYPNIAADRIHELIKLTKSDR